ncbi:leucine efflux protein LeuE [Nocardioides jiangxiensis]|uniref:Leucine efflux protein LeuE n=1 Tax=Nocardioides jiangxiensis TaxID=3064524 RepID=A0ABT9B0D2_9ACTN|nr:leucine efflux protein LeuE [Nocardioides sp. WY-20]MDO7868133.1 leucine efflux protein LeuE [Nocardioides sp. WY-20]
MLGVTDLTTYVIGLVLIILLPGPNSMYVVSVAARRGTRAGYTAAAGVWTGDTVLMVLTAAGVAGVLRTNPLLFAVVKYIGAGYLAWLAVAMLRGAWATWRSRRLAAAIATGVPIEAPGERPYHRALVISLFNPKAILFFVAFFVQFVDPDYAWPALTFLFLGVLCQIASVLYLSALIFFGARLADAFRRRSGLSAAGTSAVGVVFLGFATKLALAHA